MNKKRIAIIFVLVVTALTTSPAGLSARQNSPLKVQNKVQLAATPFPLSEVRLLDGPFREAMLRDQKYLLDLDNDRLLHMFRVTAGLPSTAKPYGGWEAPDVQLRGHSMGHFLSACALMYASTGDERFKTKADALVAELAKVQQSLAAKGFNAGYLSAFPEEFFDLVDKRERVWAPYYTIHKMMAGLLDMYLLCDNKLYRTVSPNNRSKIR